MKAQYILESTKIMTDKGIEEIKDAVVGNQVLARKKRFCKVMKKYVCESKDAIKMNRGEKENG